MSTSQSLQMAGASRLLSALAVLSASLASGYLLWPAPGRDVFFAGIVLLSVAFALAGSVGAWTNRTALIWVAALLLVGLAGLGMMSIGLFIVPAALLTLGAAVASHQAGPRVARREAIRAESPTAPAVARKLGVGIVAIAIGAAVVYAGAVERELFGSCARETLRCAVATTHWDAVGVTLFGLVAACLGGWVVGQQIYVSWVLVAKQGN